MRNPVPTTGRGRWLLQGRHPREFARVPNAAQYYGKVVNGVDGIVLVGAYLFPQNTSITGLEADA